MKANVEKIWHFTSKFCKMWFSIAVMDDWKPKNLYCPHCGKQQEIVNDSLLKK
jgi:transposase